MQRCYTKNFEAIEVSQRERLVAILDGDWRSAGPGQPLDPHIPAWDRTTRF